MRDEGKNRGGTRDNRTFNGGIEKKYTSAGAGFAHFDRRDAG